uniref:Uncharacterized protein n=1 Tax=Arundo donax TaxID=35708 RepID=A0A0A9G2V8_ARUDO
MPSGSTSNSLAHAFVYPASCRLSSAAITPQILASAPSPCCLESLAVWPWEMKVARSWNAP